MAAGYHPRTHHRPGADPDAVFQHDGLHNEIERWLFVVVVAREQEGALGDADVRADGHLLEVVDPHMLAEPAVVADRELPGEFDLHRGFDHHAAAHSGSEAAQPPDFGQTQHGQLMPEEHRADHVPGEFLKEGCTSGELGVGEGGEV